MPDSFARDDSEEAFRSLVERSIAAWKHHKSMRGKKRAIQKHSRLLRRLKTLDELLLFRDEQYWFFQLREAFLRQRAFRKWSSDHLHDYILLPIENGFANPNVCVFLSHFWHEVKNPDQHGSDLKPVQDCLNDGLWPTAAFFWVDFTCLPQMPRTEPQNTYFSRALKSISRLVRDCAFTWQFPQFRPRLWVLLEAAEFTRNRAQPISRQDMDPFMRHLREMKGYGVRYVLNRHGYRCTNRSDRELVVGWLEILLILSRLVINIRTRRDILNAIDKFSVRSCYHEELGIAIDKEKGLVTLDGRTWDFTPILFDHDVAESDTHVHIPTGSWHEKKLQKEMKKAEIAFERGYENFGRTNERQGEYRIAEELFRKALDEERGSGAICVIVALDFLAGNLEKQGRYEEAEKFRYEKVALAEEEYGPRNSTTRDSKAELAVTSQNAKQAAFFRRWKQESLDQILGIERPNDLETGRSKAHQPENADRIGSQEALWLLLEWRKETLGPYAAKTLNTLLDLAQAIRAAGDLATAERLFWIALALSDDRWGQEHCHTLSIMTDLAATMRSAGKMAEAKETYRQQLERQLRVVDTDHPDAFTAYFELREMLDRNETLMTSKRGVQIRSNG
jgi:tetratricopeptide (TPR) repeat protein